MFVKALSLFAPLRRRPRNRRHIRRRALRPECLEERTLLSLTPLNAEFQANTFVANEQEHPSVAADAEGDFVAVWASRDQDQQDNRFGVFGQRYDASGAPVGGEFQVNTFTAESQRDPVVAMDADGDFVVAWQSFEQVDGYDVFARRYDKAGNPQGDEFQVNTTTLDDQRDPAVAMDADGDFLVAWQSFGQVDGDDVFARQYNAAGVAQGDEFQVNTTTDGEQSEPTVAMDADGDAVIAWQSFGQDGDGRGIFAGRLDPGAQSIGAELQVNTETAGDQERPSVAMNGDGFAVTWESGNDIFAQRFDLAGTERGSQFQVNLTTGARTPEVAMNEEGNFFVGWSASLPDGDGLEILLREFDPAGIAQSGEIHVNSFIENGQQMPVVAASEGSAVVAWQSFGQDSDDDGVFVRRLAPTRPGAAAVGAPFFANTTIAGNQQDPAAAADAEGNSVIVWESRADLTDDWDVFGQRFDAAGEPLGPEFLVSSSADGDQRNPDVAMNGAGEFVVAWEFFDSSTGWQTIVQLFDPEGVRVGPETDMDSASVLSGEREPSVAIDEDGDFVVAAEGQDPYQSNNGIRAQRFTADGQPNGPHFLVEDASDSPVSPAAAMDDDGDFVIVWEADDASIDGIFARRYDAAGMAQGDAFPVNVTTADAQREPDVAMTPEGAFTVVWQHFPNIDNLFDIYRRRFDPAGNALEDEYLVSSTVVGRDDDFPAIGIDDSGRSAIAWEGNSGDFFARAFDGQGVPFANDFLVAAANNADKQAALAMSGQGDFLVAYSAEENRMPGDGCVVCADPGMGVFAQRYSLNLPFLGPETHVNAHSMDSQGSPSVAADADGDYVVAWHSNNQDGDQLGVFAQRYSSAGEPQGEEFQVNTETDNGQNFPRVALDEDGDFVIAWNSYAQDGDGYGVFAKRFNAAGQPLDAPGTPGVSEFQVNTTADGNQERVDIAGNPGGRFAIVWESAGDADGDGRGIFARLYDANGQPLGDEFQVNGFTTGDQRSPRVAMDDDGDIVVAWESNGQDGDGYGIYAQRFDSAGAMVGDEFQVHNFTDGAQTRPSVAVDADGDFAIAWHGEGEAGYGVYARRFDSAGQPLDGPFHVSETTRGQFASVAFQEDGRLVVTWQANDADGFGAFARRYDTEGQPITQEFLVNSTIVGGQRVPNVSAMAVGQFIVVWEGQGPGDDDGVFAQRFGESDEEQPPPDVIGRTDAGEWWLGVNDGQSLSNRLFGFWSPAADWRDVVSADFDNDGDDDILGRAAGGDWWLGRNTGEQLENVFFGQWAPIGWSDVTVADLTGDGLLDVIGRSPAGEWWVGVNNDGDSLTNEFFGFWNEAADWRDVMATDFDLDGDADILGRASGGDWWLGRSDGSGLDNEPLGNWAPINWNDVSTADFTGDGFPDVVGRTDGGEWWVARNDSGAALVNQRFGVWGAINWNDIAYADFDGDSDIDALGRTDGGDWWLAANDAGSGFVNVAFGSWAGIEWRDVLFADFDGAGFLNALGRAPSGDWWLALNDGSGFASSVPYGFWSEPAGWHDVAAGQYAEPEAAPDSFGSPAEESGLALAVALHHDEDAPSPQLQATDRALQDESLWLLSSA